MRTEAPEPISTIATSAARPRVGLLGLAALALAALFAIFAAPALAARSAETPITGFTTPKGLTTDASNNLWVTDTGTHKVSVYSSAGALLHENDGTGSWGANPYTESLAFDAAANKVFASDSNADDLWGLNPADASNTGTDLNAGLGGGCCFIKVAADNSAGATAGDLYVPSHLGTPKVLRVTSAGAADNFSFSASYISGNELTGTGTEAFSAPAAAAVDGSGHLFVADAGTGKVYEFEPSGEFLRAFTEAGGSPFGSVNGVAIDPTTGNVLVSDETEGKVDEFTSAGSFVESTAVTGAAGLAVDSTGRLYAVSGTEVDVFSSAGPAATLFPLEVTVSGEGEVTSAPAGIACTAGTCTHEFEEGSTVTLTETPQPGSEFAGWTGCTAEPSATECEVAMSAAEAVTAGFVPRPTQNLEVSVTGQGEVNSNPTGISGCEAAAGTCTAPFSEGLTVTLTATHASGWKFAGWTGCTHEAGNECEVEIGAGTASVSAEFVETHEFPLTVFVTGNGSVSADSGTISGCTEAGGAACEGEYEGPVVLTATPASGYVFAGWIGCKHKSATECEVTVNAEKEVYAVFLREGTEGAPGQPGQNGETPTITPFSGNQHGCPEGGFDVAVNGTHTYVCNGKNGTNGSNGSNGSNGATGPEGKEGKAGAQGPAGQNGPQGAQGPQGPAGPAAKVTCKVKQKGKKIKVTCTVKQGASASSARLRWSLTQGGRTVRHGTTAGRRSRLNLSGLAKGRYQLHIVGQKGATAIVVA